MTSEEFTKLFGVEPTHYIAHIMKDMPTDPCILKMKLDTGSFGFLAIMIRSDLRPRQKSVLKTHVDTPSDELHITYYNSIAYILTECFDIYFIDPEILHQKSIITKKFNWIPFSLIKRKTVFQKSVNNYIKTHINYFMDNSMYMKYTEAIDQYIIDPLERKSNRSFFNYLLYPIVFYVAAITASIPILIYVVTITTCIKIAAMIFPRRYIIKFMIAQLKKKKEKDASVKYEVIDNLEE